MWILDIFKKHEKKNSREEALKRLDNMMSRRREIIQKIPQDVFEKNSEEIKKEVIRVISAKFNVPAERVKVDCQEEDGYVVIVTNINFK
ncbi:MULTISPECIES: trigger factor [unclassified Thermosipho (in: thermotogales)]|uniref:trigger factor n=1 Tax=unclassified Thermosipho (in: thermotogales) TaxID=2676525 RepID=UPI0009847FB4|nr:MULTISPECIES: trigger factor [unclassified Thermosipho (in: thermotogales)]MBT1247932.1 trigger factor [Thermosipho sp. 1244]OOC46109.1 trigger factor [Thermosipho sp. 1223]